MRKYVFADEAGNFDFSRHPSASAYFILCTVSFDSCDIGTDLLELRRAMAWDGYLIDGPFHASTDKQSVRDRVYDFLQNYDFRVDATILQKSKAQPQTRAPEFKEGSINTRFYKYAWHYHFKHVAPRITDGYEELFLSAASIGAKKKLEVIKASLNDVVQQSVSGIQWKAVCWPVASDPCLQIADYCCWAIQRKWELGDSRSHNLIADKIASEYDLWARGRKEYY